MNRKRVFLSYSERDADLATALRAVIASYLRLDERAVFQSGDRSIRSGQQVLPAITKAVHQSDAVIVLLTPNSLWSPWLHFEAGGGYFSQTKLLVVLSARGIGPESLPSDLLFHSVKDLGSDRSVRHFLEDLAQGLRCRATRALSPAKVHKVVEFAQKGTRGWELVQPALVARNIGGSPFEFLAMLEGASQSAFAVGQNLWSFTRGPAAARIQRRVFRFLERKGTSVRIILQAPQSPGATAWNSLLPQFSTDLQESLSGFRKWLARARKNGINTTRRKRLDIRTAALVPVSFDLFDADLPSGRMVIRHALHRAPRAHDRPAFALYGGPSNPVFKYYSDVWSTAFQEGTSLR